MNSLPPAWESAIFNSSAFQGDGSITKQQADLLYASLYSIRNIDYINNITPGVVSASKSVIVDSTRSINNFNTISLTNSTASFVSIQTTSTTSFSSLRFISDVSTWEIGSRNSANSGYPNHFYIFNSAGSPSFKFTMGLNGHCNYYGTGTSIIPANNAFQLAGGLYTAKDALINGFINCRNENNTHVGTANNLNSINLNNNFIYFKGIGSGSPTDPYHGIGYSGTGISTWNSGQGFASQSVDGPILWGNQGVLIGNLAGTGTETWVAKFDNTASSFSGRVIANGNLQSPNIRATGFSTTNWTGSGVELNYDSPNTIGNILCYNRTSLLYRTLKLQSSMYLDPFGNVGINTAVPSCLFHVSGSTAISTASSFGYLNSSGTAGLATGFTNRQFSARFSNSLLLDSGEINIISDIRFKENIENLDTNLVNDFITKVEPIKYNYINSDTQQKHYGYSAQELVKNKFNILVGTVKSDEPLESMEIIDETGDIANIPVDTRLVINTANIIPILHKALKLSNEQIKLNRIEIADLNERLNEVIDIINN